MTKAILQGYLTTLFGAMSGLPVIVLGVFSPGTALALSPYWTHILMVTGGVGLVGLGIVSKAFNEHSTPAQVAAAGAAVSPNPQVQAQAPAMMKAANDQIAQK